MEASIVLERRPAFCRFYEEQLIVSTYQLDDKSRSGSLHFLEENLENNLCLPMDAGVFRFELTPDERGLVAALTNGTLAQVSIDQKAVTSTTYVTDSMLLDVSMLNEKCLCSDNHGHLMLVDRENAKVSRSWNAHELPFTKEECEVWTCAFLDQNTCGSGGDDAALRLWDLRTENKIADVKFFDGGVTFLASSSINDSEVITGSYDEHIRIFDRRMTKNILNERKLFGGVWNIEQDGNKLVAACMYGGWAILDYDLQVIVLDNDAGKTLLYGASMNGEKLAYVTFNDYRVTEKLLKL